MIRKATLQDLDQVTRLFDEYVVFYNKEDKTGNKFYSIYEKFHEDMKNKKIDSVTVEKIGGTECQKCHY